MANYRIPGPLDASRGNHDVRDGTLQRTPGVVPGHVGGAEAGHTSAWDPLNYYYRAECLVEAAQIGRDHAPAAILRETGHALKEVIEGLLPGLLMMLAVVGATTAIGGAAGAVVGGVAGFFGGAGVGAAPGAAAGAVTGGELGMSLGFTILTWLGLGFLIVAIGEGVAQLGSHVAHATVRAWNAHGHPQRRREIDAAGEEFATAVALLFKLILMAIVARLTMGQAKASTQETLSLLRKSKLGEGFAEWVATNREALLKNPKLQVRQKAALSEKPVEPPSTPSQVKKAKAAKEEPPPPPPPPPTAAEAVAARQKLASDFYAQQGYKEHQIPGHLNGIDFTKPVDVVTLPKGTVVEQWQVPGGPQGNYYAPPGTMASELGISPQGTIRATGEVVDKVSTRYVLSEDVQVLRSTAKDIVDTWSVPGKSVQTLGGGTQYMSSKVGSFIPGG